MLIEMEQTDVIPIKWKNQIWELHIDLMGNLSLVNVDS